LTKDIQYAGVRARLFGRLKKKEPLSFKVSFYTKDKQLFAEYLLDARHEHEAWIVAHERLCEDYPEQDPGQYIFVIEAP